MAAISSSVERDVTASHSVKSVTPFMIVLMAAMNSTAVCTSYILTDISRTIIALRVFRGSIATVMLIVSEFVQICYCLLVI